MKKALSALILSSAGIFTSAAAQSQSVDGAGEQSSAVEPKSNNDDTIVVTGESDRERVKELGKVITRPARANKAIARFHNPICLKVSGLPVEMAELVATRIKDNISSIPALRMGGEGCKPNAFVGVLNNVNEVFDSLLKEEKWLFTGLFIYQKKRISKGSEAVRAWHVFGERNIDGTEIPGKQRGASDAQSIASSANRVHYTGRSNRTPVEIAGAVVLVETAALQGKTFRQLADYATIRILASVTDEIDGSRPSLPTILTLFDPSSAYQPPELSGFDRAYLDALYELPINSRDAQVIAAAGRRYRAADRVEE
tara:strand:+ start:153 stop:1088 length:936 start_codon:yes stop_codon:yes gene_type:complete